MGSNMTPQNSSTQCHRSKTGEFAFTIFVLSAVIRQNRIRTSDLKITWLPSKLVRTFRVCDKGARATDLYTIGTAGLIVGTAFFSWFADWRGRRPAFFVSTLIVIIFQLAKIGLADNYTAYLIVKVMISSWMNLWIFAWYAELLLPVDKYIVFLWRRSLPLELCCHCSKVRWTSRLRCVTLNSEASSLG